jgi:thiosulfate/3-mercaptopyruvate sulfurtransferase
MQHLSAPRRALVGFGALVLSFGLLGGSTVSARSLPSSTAPTPTIVETSWLEANLTNPKVRIIEVSTEPGLYEKGHIPGAYKFSWHTDFVDPVNRDIAQKEQFQKTARAAGVNNDSIVVLYGDKNNWFSAWGVWVFKTYGAKDVRILNGGRDKWIKEGRAFTPIPANPPKGNFTATSANRALRSFLPDVVRIAKKQDKTTKLVDIRSADEFSGKIFAPAGFQELAIRAGHIPGAVNVPWSSAVGADGTFKSPADLKKIYADAGIDGKKKVIVYCRIGERAAHTWFVLSQILGYDVKLYDGSWTEYGNSVGVPIANPAGTVWGKG